jgi:CheY-like chemotaxis protein
LIVDDNLENRILLRQLLEPVGFRVWEAAGGREAIDLHQKVQADLIWMDIRMPGMDGYEAAQRIRELEKGRRDAEGRELHTPIVALTAGVMEHKQSSPLAGVFDDWVYKPFREAELFEKVAKHLGAKFVYQSSGLSEEKGPGEPALRAEDLAGLPRDWLKRFLPAVKRGRAVQMQNLIEEIRPEFGNAAKTLTTLINLYRFETLMAMTAEALARGSEAPGLSPHGRA